MREAMRNRRLEMECSQADIAKLIGVSPGFYANVERGIKKPGPDNLLALESLFGIPAATLIGNDAPKAIPTEYTN
jgi:transcriptional regulator with XRE-family HTH domain